MAYKRISPQPVVEGGTGRSTLTNHGLLIGAGTTGITQSSVGATGTVLIGNSAADPTFTATPVVTSINFGGSSLSTFVDWTNWTPTLTGASTAGTTTYTGQLGYYSRIGNIVNIWFNVSISAATGTGPLVLGGLPFTIFNNVAYAPQGSVFTQGLTFSTGGTSATIYGSQNTNTCFIYTSGTAITGGFANIANSTIVLIGSLTYRV